MDNRGKARCLESGHAGFGGGCPGKGPHSGTSLGSPPALGVRDGKSTTLPLAERTYRCEHCGLVLDRDVNAAANLLRLAASGAERVNACGGTVRPGAAGRVPVKQEPGTARAVGARDRPEAYHGAAA